MDFTASHRRRFDLRRGQRWADGRLGFIKPGDGLPSRHCMMCDISDGGARLVVDAPETLPAEFILAEGIDGASRRRSCRIVWRGEAQVGVQFVAEPEAPGDRS